MFASTVTTARNVTFCFAFLGLQAGAAKAEPTGEAAYQLHSLLAAELEVGTAVLSDGTDSVSRGVEELPLGTATLDGDAGSLQHDGGVPRDSEVVRERYPNRRVKVERYVVQDADQNYVNHGPWRMWDPEGNLIVEGAYSDNQRTGQWSRWYKPEDAKLFTAEPFRQFEPPFLSRAEFGVGELDGVWTIIDTKRRKVCEWHFVEGRRHGASKWWYPNGQPMRELHYELGEIHGDLLEWSTDGELVTRDRYESGRRIAQRVDKYPNGQKKSEGTYLAARLEVKTPDAWWDAELAQYTRQGDDEKHGEWSSWYENGQKRVVGSYDHNKPHGTFVWWHANGQKALEANYVEGKENGLWTWWHENGLKSISGSYTFGSPDGQWIWWSDAGKVAQRVDFSRNSAGIAQNDFSEFPNPATERETYRSGQRSVLRQ